MRACILFALIAAISAGACESSPLPVSKPCTVTIGKAARIVCAGDSITSNQGLNPVPPFFCWPTVLELLLKQKGAGQVQIVNAGVGGNTTAMLRARWYNDVVQWNPDVVCVLIGINDIHQNIDNSEYEWKMTQMISELRSQRPKCTVIIMSTFLIAAPDGPVVPSINNGFNETHRAKIPYFIRSGQAIADQFENCKFLNLQDVFNKALRDAKASYYCEESVHPKERGNYVIAKAVSDLLEIGE